MFPTALSFIQNLRPRAALLDNVRGLLQGRFAPYRASILHRLAQLRYAAEWRLLYACDYGVPSSADAPCSSHWNRTPCCTFAGQSPLPTHPQLPSSAKCPRLDGVTWLGARRCLGAGGTTHLAHSLRRSPQTRAPRLGLFPRPADLGRDGSTVPALLTRLPRTGIRCPSSSRWARWRACRGVFAGRKTSAYRQVGNTFLPTSRGGGGQSHRYCAGAGRLLGPLTS